VYVEAMIRTDPPTCLPTRFQEHAAEQLARAGRSPDAVEALLALDRALFLWQRRVMKGEMPRVLLQELGIDLELAQFHALTAVIRIEGGIGRERAEPATVGLLAEELSLDPSRASRIAGDLVAKDFLRREADQGDGRRIVLRLTEQARAAMASLRERKWARLVEVFADWSDEDIRTFAALFERYREGMTRACGG
jgi:DNA-binding MarR family transcriptional regulator